MLVQPAADDGERVKRGCSFRAPAGETIRFTARATPGFSRKARGERGPSGSEVDRIVAEIVARA
ncbi:hypothetical protein ACX841_25245, partial [Burkholderia pseudomallei]